MSNESPSKNNRTLTFLGSLGAILIFLLIVLVAYLPNRAEPVDAEIVRERQVRADEARAAGLKRITGFEVVNQQEGVVRIPVAEAMEMTVRDYQAGMPPQAGGATE